MRRIYSKIALTLALQLSVAAIAKAQDINGQVVDKLSGQPIIGAVVEIDGNKERTVTDIDGKFSFSGLKKGKKYTLFIRYISYKTQNIDGVQAKPEGSGQPLRVELQADEQTLSGVTVTGVARRNTEAAMIQQTRASSVIVSNVSAQEIQRTQDSNAGEVIRRVPGVSLIDDKFVMVRGLSQRYNNVWINGGAVPSSEADTRAFSFDMIPSSQIDNLTIVKTPTAEYPADYTGGFILINTKEIPTKNSFHINVGGNWNSQSAMHESLQTKSSSTDWLGFDSGLRSLHGGIDATLHSLGENTGGNTMYSLSDNHLTNDWNVRRSHPFGSNGTRLGMTAAINYTNEYRTNLRMLNNFYGVYDVGNDRSNPLRLSTDNQYNHNVRLGAMLNLTLLSASGRNKYQFKNIFNQIGNSRYTWREGTSAQSEPEKSAE